MLCVGLQCVTVVFPDHTPFFKKNADFVINHSIGLKSFFIIIQLIQFQMSGNQSETENTFAICA